MLLKNFWKVYLKIDFQKRVLYKPARFAAKKMCGGKTLQCLNENGLTNKTLQSFLFDIFPGSCPLEPE